MNKIRLLAWANVKKSKGHTVSLFFLFLIASLLLNTGLLVLNNFGSFFDNIKKELNATDTFYAMPSSMYTTEVKEYLESNSNIREMQSEEIYWGDVVLSYQKKEREANLALFDADQERTLSKWKFIGEHQPAEEMSIYLPYIFKLDGGYELNDILQIEFNGKNLTFTVKGFVEDIFFSSFDTGLLSGYVSHETFELIADQLSDEKATLVFTNEEVIDSQVVKAIRELSGTDPSTNSTKAGKGLYSIDLSLIELSRVFMSSIVAVMVVVFAAIIVLVNLIVVRFRIGISIIDDMTKIGSLKAVGYTSRQIMLSMAYQYTLIAFAGSVAGIVFSYLFVPILSDVFAVQSGLKWEQGFDIVVSSLALLILLAITMVVAYISSRRINRLTPIIALRGGIITHSFRKNPMPLHKARGRLTVALAMKGLLQSKKQSIMIALIVIAISFAGAFSVIMYYNTAIDTRTFAETPGIELSNVAAVRKPGADGKQILEEIRQLPGVKKVQYLDELSVTIEENEIKAFVMEDFSTKETNTIYEGRYPIHSNEIVLAGRFAEQIHKGIRDKVIVEMGDKKEEFLVTGLSQGSNMGGKNVSITLDGMQRLNPDLELSTLNIYLEKDEVTSKEFTAMLELSYAHEFVGVTDIDEKVVLGMQMYADIVGKVGLAILVITVLIVILVLYFVINSSVVRKKRELGIQKAIGFTTFQLMNQLSLGFLPPVIAGVGVGCILGISQGNNLMTLAQKSMGIMKANYIIKPTWILLFGAAIILVSYITSLLITYRIRKISAYALVTE